jgi:hypothetical protein
MVLNYTVLGQSDWSNLCPTLLRPLDWEIIRQLNFALLGSLKKSHNILLFKTSYLMSSCFLTKIFSNPW